MMRIFSIILLLSEGIMIAYGGFKLYSSYAMESNRLAEANEIVSNKIISIKETIENNSLTQSFNYNSIQEGDTIGILYIPRLEREIPIIEGTNEEELAQGVGHYIDTGFPGENKQILLSGHRDTVFRNFGELKEVDEFLTVSTCYPFSYIGNAPDRYVIYAYPK